MTLFSLIMHRRRHRGLFAMVLIVILALASLNGCALIKHMTAPEDFEKEEKSLTQSIKEERQPYFLSDAYLQRARLRMRADNPRIDYGGALEDLKRAANLNPELRNVRDWIAALSRLAKLDQEISQLKAKNEQAERQNRSLKSNVEQAELQNRSLKSNVEQLEKQEQELKKTIEELQSLQLQMEQRRQKLR